MNTFCPKDPASREEVVDWIWRMVQWLAYRNEGFVVPAEHMAQVFSDVPPGHPFEVAINALADARIVDAKSPCDGTTP